MEFGIVLPTMNNGNIISEAAPQWMPTWDLNKRAVQKAERYGFQFALAQVTLRGFGGRTEMWDHGLEALTLSSGLLAVTEKIRIYGSAAILAMNPAIVARMAVTINEVAGGRFGVNIVSGWVKDQFTQMGAWPGDDWFARRYEGAGEFVTILRELWEHGVSDFKGNYYRMDDCRMGPRPAHKIDVVCAGQSEAGMRFTAEHGDYAFILGEGGVEGVRRVSDRLLAAGEVAGRDVSAYVCQIVILGETDDEAQAKVAAYKAGADIEALERIMGQAALDPGATATKIAEHTDALREGIFFNIDYIAGAPATVAAYFDEMATVEGVAGVMIIFEDVLNDLDTFARRVAPLMKARSTVSAAPA